MKAAVYQKTTRKRKRDQAKTTGDLCTRCTVRPRRPDRKTCQHCADLQAAAYATAAIKRNVRRLLGQE